MNKKITMIISALLMTLLLFVGYKTFLSPKGVEGNKEVSIHIINEDKNVDETFIYKTDKEFLLSLLEKHQKELGASFQKFDFGTMVTGMMNYIADEKKEYFHLYVNDEDATTGPGEVPLNDKDTYTFELKKL